MFQWSQQKDQFSGNLKLPTHNPRETLKDFVNEVSTGQLKHKDDFERITNLSPYLEYKAVKELVQESAQQIVKDYDFTSVYPKERILRRRNDFSKVLLKEEGQELDMNLYYDIYHSGFYLNNKPYDNFNLKLTKPKVPVDLFEELDNLAIESYQKGLLECKKALKACGSVKYKVSELEARIYTKKSLIEISPSAPVSFSLKNISPFTPVVAAIHRAALDFALASAIADHHLDSFMLSDKFLKIMLEDFVKQKSDNPWSILQTDFVKKVKTLAIHPEHPTIKKFPESTLLNILRQKDWQNRIDLLVKNTTRANTSEAILTELKDAIFQSISTEKTVPKQALPDTSKPLERENVINETAMKLAKALKNAILKISGKAESEELEDTAMSIIDRINAGESAIDIMTELKR